MGFFVEVEQQKGGKLSWRWTEMPGILTFFPI